MLNCYIDGKLLIRGHDHRVLVLWSINNSGFQTLRLLVVVKPVHLERNQIALLAKLQALLVTELVERKSHLERAKFIRSSIPAP